MFFFCKGVVTPTALKLWNWVRKTSLSGKKMESKRQPQIIDPSSWDRHTIDTTYTGIIIIISSINNTCLYYDGKILTEALVAPSHAQKMVQGYPSGEHRELNNSCNFSLHWTHLTYPSCLHRYVTVACPNSHFAKLIISKAFVRCTNTWSGICTSSYQVVAYNEIIQI